MTAGLLGQMRDESADPRSLGPDYLIAMTKIVTGRADSDQIDRLKRLLKRGLPPPDPSLVHNIETSVHRPPSGCGNAVFWFTCKDCGYKTHKISGCGKRTCSDCAKKRRAKLIATYGPWIKGFKWPVLITLTLKRVEFLSEGGERIVKAFHEVRRQKWWDATAGVWTMEYLKKPDGWHVHLHCIADARWIDQKKLSAAWQGVTGDSFIVDVRRVRNRKIAMLEVLKYCTKNAQLTSAEKDMVEMVLKGKRFINWFGLRPVLAKAIKKDLPCPRCGGVMVLDDWVCIPRSGYDDST